MGIASGLDRQIQFQRAIRTPDGFGGFDTEWQEIGEAIWSLRRDVRDTEAVQAGRLGSTLMTRFQVRSTAFTRQITTDDQLITDGQLFGIIGIKEPATGQRRQLIEITAETIT